MNVTPQHYTCCGQGIVTTESRLQLECSVCGNVFHKPDYCVQAQFLSFLKVTSGDSSITCGTCVLKVIMALGKQKAVQLPENSSDHFRNLMQAAKNALNADPSFLRQYRRPMDRIVGSESKAVDIKKITQWLLHLDNAATVGAAVAEIEEAYATTANVVAPEQPQELTLEEWSTKSKEVKTRKWTAEEVRYNKDTIVTTAAQYNSFIVVIHTQ